jgi:hypothetical protein
MGATLLGLAAAAARADKPAPAPTPNPRAVAEAQAKTVRWNQRGEEVSKRNPDCYVGVCVPFLDKVNGRVATISQYNDFHESIFPDVDVLAVATSPAAGKDPVIRGFIDFADLRKELGPKVKRLPEIDGWRLAGDVGQAQRDRIVKRLRSTPLPE